MSDFGKVRQHTGRKDHVCAWCGETIPKGEKFEHYVGKWQGEFQNWRMHIDCYEASTNGDELFEGFGPHEHKRGSTEPR